MSFLPEYGPKLKEDYVSVGHLPKIQKDRKKQCCSCGLFNCCKSNWQKVSSFLHSCFVFRYFVVVSELFNWLFVQQVWVVLKPGFLALLEDPFDPKLLDVIIFDALPHMDINGEGQISLAKEIKERNPLHFGFQVPIPFQKFFSSNWNLFWLITCSSFEVQGTLNNNVSQVTSPKGPSHTFHVQELSLVHLVEGVGVHPCHPGFESSLA